MRSYKTELDPNKTQEALLFQSAGAARWTYNWGLQKKMEAYEAGRKTPTSFDLQRELNALKKVPYEQSGIPWMYDVSKCCPQEALNNLDFSYKSFFRRCKNGDSRKGFPKFKSRKHGVGSFTLTGVIKIFEGAVQLPRFGIVRVKEARYLPAGVKVTAATVSERAGRWFVAIRTDELEPCRPAGAEILGVDVGIKALAVLSDGTIFENPKAFKKAEKSLKFCQRQVSKKQKGSNRRKKAVKRLSKQHYRVSCIRNDAIHKATTAIAKRASVVGIETLNVQGLLRNHCIAESLSDAGLSKFHRQLGYKMGWHGGVVVKADQFYPSSKTCSACGVVKKELKLSDRVFKCVCGFVADRDLNAAINLRNNAVSSTVSARGGLGDLPLPVKREFCRNQ